MRDPTQVTLPQNQETAVTSSRSGLFTYRYAYARSADSRKNNETGQDYLKLRTHDNRFVFALCDGVSQSFYGDLAARVLGDQLVDWLWMLNPAEGEAAVGEEIESLLSALAAQAREQVLSYPLDPSLVPMLRAALEKKRAIGSESTFVCGMIDRATNLAAFFWMGDSRLRLWQGDTEITRSFEGQFLTRERWSTNKGMVGNLHRHFMKAETLRHMAAYSDGFSLMDAAYEKSGHRKSFSDTMIGRLMEDAGNAAASDDISFLELWVGDKPAAAKTAVAAKPLTVYKSTDPASGKASFHWADLKADRYEVRVSSDQGTLKTVSVKNPAWQDSETLSDPNAKFVSVRPWVEEEPGTWSEPVATGETPVTVVAPVKESLPQNKVESPQAAPKRSGFKAYALYAIVVSGLVCSALAMTLFKIIVAPGDSTPTATLPVPFIFASPSATPSLTPTSTATPTATIVTETALSSSLTPSDTPTASPTPGPTHSATPSGTPTDTPTYTATPTSNPNPTLDMKPVENDL